MVQDYNTRNILNKNSLSEDPLRKRHRPTQYYFVLAQPKTFPAAANRECRCMLIYSLELLDLKAVLSPPGHVDLRRSNSAYA